MHSGLDIWDACDHPGGGALQDRSLVLRKEEAGDGVSGMRNIQVSTEHVGVDGITHQVNGKWENKISGPQTFLEVKILKMIK